MQANDALWIMLFAFIIGLLFFIIWFLSYDSLQQTYNVNGLNEANRLALYDSVDYASRGQRGVFYLDVQKYYQDLRKLPIRRFDHEALNPGVNCRILVLPDMTNTTDGTSHNTSVYSNYPSSIGKHWNKARLAPSSGNPDSFKDVPVRGVLIATDFGDSSIGNRNQHTKKGYKMVKNKDGSTTTTVDTTKLRMPPIAKDSNNQADGILDEIFDNQHDSTGKNENKNIDADLYVSTELINTYGRPIKGSHNHRYNPYDTENDISR